MPIKYYVNERSTPFKPEEPKKWYAHTKSAGYANLKTLGEKIAQRSAVNSADTQAVLAVLTEVLIEHLSDGEIVKLDNFGSFQVRIDSNGAEMATKFDASMIKNQKVVFRPGSELKMMLYNLEFEKV